MFVKLTALLLLWATISQACPEPQTMVHIQNYDGPIIVHSTTCDNQHRNPSNHYNYNQCENDCTCVTKQGYYPSGLYPTTGYGCGNQYCNVDDVRVYSADYGYSGYNYGDYNRCGNNNYNYQYKYPVC